MSNNTEHINISTQINTENWQPSIGDETLALLTHLGLPQNSQQTLMKETSEILSKCGNTSQIIFSEIGLAFGYVQSGKTMSLHYPYRISKGQRLPNDNYHSWYLNKSCCAIFYTP